MYLNLPQSTLLIYLPLPLFRAAFTSFSDIKNDVLGLWQKNTNDDNDGCNDNYNDNFYDNDDKITKKQTNINSFG